MILPHDNDNNDNDYTLGLLPKARLKSFKLSSGISWASVLWDPRAADTNRWSGRDLSLQGHAHSPTRPQQTNGVSAGTRPLHSAVGASQRSQQSQSVSAQSWIGLMLERSGVSGGAGLRHLRLIFIINACPSPLRINYLSSKKTTMGMIISDHLSQKKVAAPLLPLFPLLRLLQKFY